MTKADGLRRDDWCCLGELALHGRQLPLHRFPLSLYFAKGFEGSPNPDPIIADGIARASSMLPIVNHDGM